MREADTTDLEPVTRAEFAAAIAPCLQLVAPVGMDLESQDTWMEAAFKALDGIPIGLLKRGAEVAMKTADHPAKIIPAIMREIEQAWKWRREYRGTGAPRLCAPVEPEPDRCTPEQAAAIMAEFGLKRNPLDMAESEQGRAA